ncbi:IPT/TIG domain-containing protein [Aquiflexum sp.]|uniref:IPT/TIG domain-containing protein n=1 Tax=Aquiflexum sp. TaxID=1872584 RepID=UPI0035948DE5
MNKSNIGVISFLVILMGIFSSCEEENIIPPSLITEEVIYLSGERVRLLGRILTTQNINANDHGFYVAENEAFNQPLIISLGERINPGRFIGEIEALTIERTYYAKSFINIGGEIQFGNVLQLTTLSPQIQSFSPNNGPAGTLITITGKNFTSDTQILIGNRPAEIQSIEFESRITAKIPPPGSTARETVTIIIQGREFVLNQQYEYPTGTFTKLPNPPISIRLKGNIFFQDNENFYLGLGTNADNSLNSKIWKYNLGTEQWSEETFQGNPLWLAFSTNNYFGGGSSTIAFSPYVPSRDFWRIQNGNFEKLPDLPFAVIEPVSFETNQNLYVSGGLIGNSNFKYSKSSGEWRSINPAPVSLNKTDLYFVHNDKLYIASSTNKQIYLFDPETEEWSFFGIYPGDLVGGSAGFGVTIGDRVFAGLNYRSVQVWELNMVPGSNWIKKNDFIGTPLAWNIGVFSDGEFIYLVRRLDLSGQIEFWKFDPNRF